MQGDFANRLLRKVDLPTEVIPGQLLIEILGNCRVLIENHRGVIRYSTTEISIKTQHGKVCVQGKEMILEQMSKYRVIITGCIFNVCLA